MFGWIQLTILAAIVSAALYTVHDYKSLARNNVALTNEVKTLKANAKVRQDLAKLNKEVMTQLDQSCQAQAERFLRESDIMKRIEEAEDPLTEGVNSVIVRPK